MALARSYASNGRNGFFVEGAGGAAQAMDLYATSWWLQVDPAAANNMDKKSLLAWALDALYGAPGNAGADLAAAERLQLALQLVKRINGSFDASKVTRELVALRVGDEYALDMGSADNHALSGSITGTVVVARLLQSLGQRLPLVVSHHLQQLEVSAINDRRQADLGNTITILSAVGRPFALSHSAALDVELAWIRQQLSGASLFSILTVGATVRKLAQSIDLPSVLQGACSAQMEQGLHSSTVDPQLIVDARVLGCTVVADPPPWTPIGWPTSSAISNSLAASVDGYRVALVIHQQDRYKAELTTELHQVWAPQVLDAGKQGPQYSQELALVMLARLLPTQVAVPHPRIAAVRALANSPSQGLALVPLLWLEHVSPPVPKSWSSTLNVLHNPMLAAVLLQLYYRATGERILHRMAVAQVSQLVHSGPLFYLPPGHTSPLWTTILTDWVLGRHLGFGALSATGLCNAQLQCFDYLGGVKSAQPWLQVAGALPALDLGTPYSVPTPDL